MVLVCVYLLLLSYMISLDLTVQSNGRCVHFGATFVFAYSLHLGNDRNSLTQKLHIYAADIFYIKDFVINQDVGIIIIFFFLAFGNRKCHVTWPSDQQAIVCL